MKDRIDYGLVLSEMREAEDILKPEVLTPISKEQERINLEQELRNKFLEPVFNRNTDREELVYQLGAYQAAKVILDLIYGE